MLTLQSVTTTVVFAHPWDRDEDGQPETRYVHLSGEFDLSKVKAANTGYYMIDIWTHNYSEGEF